MCLSIVAIGVAAVLILRIAVDMHTRAKRSPTSLDTPQQGEVWRLQRSTKGPWGDQVGQREVRVRIFDARDGWVRYGMGEDAELGVGMFSDERDELSNFTRSFEKVPASVQK